MAFANRIGNLLKKSITSSPSLYQAIRCMSSSKIFIGGLSNGIDDQSLREAFTNYGEVVEARVIMDRETGRSRSFGFVTFTSNEDASAAISGMDGKDLHGRMIRVNYATERTGGFRGGFGGGSYGGDGYGGGGGGSGYGNMGGSYSGSSGSGGGYSSGGGYGGGGYGDGGSNNSGGSYNTGPAGGYDGTGGGYDNASVGGSYGVAIGGGGDSYGGRNGGVVAEGGSNADCSYGRGTYGGSESTGFGSSFSNNGGYGNNNQ
ncbi:unnamed protein product [Musa hybrid cultivar]